MSRIRSLRTVSGAGAATLVAAAGLVGFTGSPALAAVGTTVTPAGHHFTASLVAGTNAVFTLGGVAVTCNESVSKGVVPDAPGNTVADGPVTSSLNPIPSFTSGGGGGCPTSALFNPKAVNTPSGNWAIALQYNPNGSTGTMTIPQGGVVTTISAFFVSCKIIVAPDGPATIKGNWVPGTAGSKPKLVFSKDENGNDLKLPVKLDPSSSAACPQGTDASFAATYEITDETDATQQIAVSEAVTQPSESPTVDPTATPSAEPTDSPTVDPTDSPTVDPTATPSAEPTDSPTVDPTDTPSF